MPSKLTPLTDHVLVKDILLPKRTAGGIHLPLPSTAHGGLIQSVRPYQLGFIVQKGPEKKIKEVPETGAVVIYCNTAGLMVDTDESTPRLRFIKAQEILAEIEDYEPEKDSASFI